MSGSFAGSDQIKMFCFFAAKVSSSRNFGWAMAMRALVRWLRVLPRSLATPYSVTMWSTSFLLVLTYAPGVSVGRIRLTVPSFPVEEKAIKLFPPLDCTAPRT